MSRAAIGPTKEDVVITEPGSGSGRHLLGTFKDQAQLACADLDEALTRAFSFARMQSVSVWLKRANRAFERLEEGKPSVHVHRVTEKRPLSATS
jgi:hypothetical protein